MEKLLIGVAVTTLVGLIVWLVQSNFNDMKKSLADINAKIVSRDICIERHRALDEKVTNNRQDIQRIYRIVHGEGEE